MNIVSTLNSCLYCNIVNAVSDKMLRCNPLDEMKYAFQLFVDGKSNTIDYHDLKRISVLISADLDEEELRGMISAFDTKGDGKS